MSTTDNPISGRLTVCIACNAKRFVRTRVPLCDKCRRELILSGLSDAPRCPRCLTILPSGRQCPVCARDKEHFISQTYAPYRYRGVVRKLVISLKFHQDLRAAALLAPAMARSVDAWQADVVVPVPLHIRREKERGYNQAGVLAYLVAEQLGLPGENVLRRPIATRRQSGLSGVAERRKNVRGVFQLAKGASVRGKKILLVDDVRTSGATALACARVLRENGAEEVRLLAAAIAPGAGRRMILKKGKRK